MAHLDSEIDALPNFSIISKIELFCWNTDSATSQNIKDFIANGVVINIYPDVIDQCVSLHKEKKIKTPDAIIAATSLACNFILNFANE